MPTNTLWLFPGPKPAVPVWVASAVCTDGCQ